MLNKLDLELFEILESELDKTSLYLELFENEKGNKPIEKWLGHYPTTNTVLRYCIKKGQSFSNRNCTLNCIIFGINKEPFYYHLDITKEIQDYTNEQKQELINFLKNI